ncbi:MAG TPA: DUF456 domain-containing protein [Candidatus Saccharimonadia bacterium]|nr:DUF456 domain-containing protein [Candidatus Saccharimonadia bacterium]
MPIEAWYVVAGIVIVVGLAGTILPALPGVPLVFAGMLLAAWAGGFERISAWTVVLLGVLTALAMAADFLATLLGARGFGASRWALVGAGLGAVVGLFFGIVGLIVGPMAGAVAGEMLAGSGLRQASKAGAGAAIGFVLGTLAKIALSFAMLGIFVFALAF